MCEHGTSTRECIGPSRVADTVRRVSDRGSTRRVNCERPRMVKWGAICKHRHANLRACCWPKRDVGTASQSRSDALSSDGESEEPLLGVRLAHAASARRELTTSRRDSPNGPMKPPAEPDASPFE